MGILFDQSLNTSDSPTFGGLTVNGSTAIDGAFTLTTPSGSGTDVKVKIDDGSSVFELYSYSGNSSPYLRVGGSTPGTSGATTIQHFETGGNHFSNFGNKDGASFFSIHQSDAATTLQSDGYRGFSDSSTASYAASPDTRLYRDGADILAMRNGATANEFRVYNTFTDSSNYERASLKWSGNDFTIGTEAAGTGSSRKLFLQSGGDRLSVFLQGSHYYNLRNTTFEPKQSGVRLGTTVDRFTQGYLGGNTITASTPMLDLSQTWNSGSVQFTGIVANITNTASAATSKLLDLQVGGSSVFEINSAGSLLLNSNSSYIGWLNSGKFYGGGTGIIEQYDGTTAQKLSVYNTRTDDSNYERFNIRWTSNTCYLETSYDGTGTYRDLVFRARNTTYIQIDSASQSVKMHRHLYPSQSGTKYLGFSSLRWVYAYTVNLNASGVVNFGGLPTSDPASAGQLWNDSGTVKISAG